ncbi:hypothetical protein V8E54_000110 [Elaphomyces granulatus]
MKGNEAETLKLNERRAVVVLDVYELLPSRHEVFHHDMPLLSRMDRKLILSSKHQTTDKEIAGHSLNVQPDFQSGTPPARVIVNTHSFHNLHILYEVIPSWLIKPVENFEDRCTKHKEWQQRRWKNAGRQEDMIGTGLSIASYLKTVGM